MAAAAKIRHNYSNFSNPYPSMDPSVKILVWTMEIRLSFHSKLVHQRQPRRSELFFKH